MDRTTNYNVWLSRCTGSLSILGSSAIIYIILSVRTRKLAKPKNRFMLMMSVFDVLQSTAIVVATAAIPRGSGLYGAMGNQATCTAQSIFMGLGLSVPLYNSSLNLFYLLTIRYNMTAARFSAKLEPLLHAFSILIPLSSAVTFTALGYAKPAATTCLYPGEISPRIGFTVIIVISFLFCIFSMGSICWSVMRQANRISRYKYGTTQTNRGTILEKEEMIKQALLYSLAFLLTFIFPTIQAAILMGKPGTAVPLLDSLSATFYPLQGFYNFVFYVRPGVHHVRETDPSKSLIGAIKEVIINAEAVSNSFIRSRRSTKRIHTPRTQTSAANIYEGTGRSPSRTTDIEEVTNDVEMARHKYEPTQIVPSNSCGSKPVQQVYHNPLCELEDKVELKIIYTQPHNTTQTAPKQNESMTDTILLPTLVVPLVEGFRGRNMRSAPRLQAAICHMNEHYNEDKGSEHDIKNKKAARRRASLVSFASVLSGKSIDSLENDMSSKPSLPTFICNMNEYLNEGKDNGQNIANKSSSRGAIRRVSLVSLASVLSGVSLDSLDNDMMGVS